MYALIIALVILSAVSFVLIFFAVQNSKKAYICSECKAEIKKKWYKMIFITHYGDGLWIKCPECSSKKLKLPKEMRNNNNG